MSLWPSSLATMVRGVFCSTQCVAQVRRKLWKVTFRLLCERSRLRAVLAPLYVHPLSRVCPAWWCVCSHV